MRFPEAAALATADAQGRPAVRHVLVKAVDERGLTFFTNRESRKGRHLAENPHAAVAFYWRELDRQVSVTGTGITRRRRGVRGVLPNAAARGSAGRLGLPAEPAGRVAGGARRGVRRGRRAIPRDDVPLPPHWGGYRLEPETIEFWQGREHRLHDRFRFTREGDTWRVDRLWP